MGFWDTVKNIADPAHLFDNPEDRSLAGTKEYDFAREALGQDLIKSRKGATDPAMFANRNLRSELMKQQGRVKGRDLNAPIQQDLGLAQRAGRDQGQLARRQQALAERAMARSRGGPSVAEAQMRRGSDRAVKQQMAMAAGSRNVGAGMRQAAQNVGDIQAQTNADAATARLREQQQAQQLALGAYGQSASTLGAMRGQQMQAGQLRGNQALQAASIEDRGLGQLYGTQAGLAQQQMQAALSEAGLDQRADMANLAAVQGAVDANLGRTSEAVKGKQNMIGGLLGGVGAAFSDRRAKEDVEDARPALEDFLSELAPKEYRYKDPAHGEGKQAGVMAQDLEDSEVGDRFVEEDPEGMKRVDYERMGPTMLASLAYLHERLGKVEGKGGKRA